MFLPPNISGVPVDCPKKTISDIEFLKHCRSSEPTNSGKLTLGFTVSGLLSLGHQFIQLPRKALSDCPATPESTLRSDFPHCKFKGIPHFQSHIDDSLVPFCMVKSSFFTG